VSSEELGVVEENGVSRAQVRRLKADLEANEDQTCTLAYMHHPRFSSGEVHGSAPEVRPL
jgi:hypothetical protein